VSRLIESFDQHTSRSRWNNVVMESEKMYAALKANSSDKSSSLFNRSVCHWTETTERDENRVPVQLKFVHCDNDNERPYPGSAHQCETIYTRFVARVRTRTIGDHWTWSWKETNVPVGCALAQPETLSASYVKRHED